MAATARLSLARLQEGVEVGESVEDSGADLQVARSNLADAPLVEGVDAEAQVLGRCGGAEKFRFGTQNALLSGLWPLRRSCPYTRGTAWRAFLDWILNASPWLLYDAALALGL